MAEEIEWLDEELCNLTKELTDQLAALTSREGKKLSKADRDDKHAFVSDRMARAKDVLSSYRVELRQVLKDVGKGTFAEYDAKGKEHTTNINHLAAELEAAKRAAETRELMEGAKKKKKRGDTEEAVPGGAAGQIINDAKRVQGKTFDSMARSERLVSEMEDMGAEANVQIRAQTEQIKATHSNVNEINEGIEKASKRLRDIGRRLATDKMIVCLVLMLLLMIVGIVVLQTLGYNPMENALEIDCKLSYNKNTDYCIKQAAQQKEAQGGEAGQSGSGGSATGAAAGGDTTANVTAAVRRSHTSSTPERTGTAVDSSQLSQGGVGATRRGGDTGVLRVHGGAFNRAGPAFERASGTAFERVFEPEDGRLRPWALHASPGGVVGGATRLAQLSLRAGSPSHNPLEPLAKEDGI